MIYSDDYSMLTVRQMIITFVKTFDVSRHVRLHHDTSGQLKLEGWLNNVFAFYTIFIDEAPCYKQLRRGGPILLADLLYLEEEAPFYLFILSKTMLAISRNCILWFMPYLEDWSSRLDQFILLAWPNEFMTT